MRLMTVKVYRAFPELDRYSDEQCRRFIAAARRGVRSWWHGVLYAIVLCLGLFIAAFIAALAFNQAADYQDRQKTDIWWVNVLAFLVAAPGLAIVPMGVLLMRDILLRKRVRWVLTTQSACPKCRYGLIGLALSPDNTITCPECGHVAAVDPSLGELTVDDQGRQQYVPAVIQNHTRFWTKQRVKRYGKRTAIAIGCLLLVAGLYEGFLRFQAGVARSQRPGSAALAALAASVQPPSANPQADNAWALFHRANVLRKQLDERIWNNQEAQLSANFVYPDATFLYSETTQSFDPARDKASADLARRMLGEYRAAGLFDMLDGIAAMPRSERLVIAPGDQPLITVNLYALGDVRAVARDCFARMALATKAGDHAEFLRAFETSLALARISSTQPGGIGAHMRAALEIGTYTQLRRFLRTHPDESTLAAIKAAMERQRSTVPITYAIETERLIVLDAVCSFFADPSNARFGRYSADDWLFPPGGGRPGGRVGTYWGNRNAVNAMFDRAAAATKLRPPTRPTNTGLNTPTHLVIPDTMTSPLARLIEAYDMAVWDREGHLLMVALERFYAANQRYPAKLDELVPAFVPSLPTDPVSGLAWGYVVVDPAVDVRDRHFLLYGFGADGADNSGARPGAASFAGKFAPLFESMTGSDVVVNED